jgi:methionyl aminopeptidase
MITLKNKAEIAEMREAGRIVARVHEALREMIKPGATTAALDARAEEIIRSHGAVPTFLGYPHTGKNDFPASICTSINEVLVSTALVGAGRHHQRRCGGHVSRLGG